MCAAMNGRLEVMRLLLARVENPVDVNAVRSVDGCTALHVACECTDRTEFVEALVRVG
jgi:ankyrin repeat protein